MAKKIIKYFFLVLLVLIIGALIVRIILSNDKSAFDGLVITDDSREAYADSGSLGVRTLSLKDKISGKGYFCAYSFFYVESTDEVQVTVRYNVSAYGYTDVEGEDDLEFVLLNMKHKQDLDTLGDDKTSEDANMFKLYDGVYYKADSVETTEKYGLYVYKKLIFKDVKLSEEGLQSDELAVVMIPAGLTLPDADDDSVTRLTAYECIFDSQTVHFADQPTDEYKLSRRDKSSLSGS